MVPPPKPPSESTRHLRAVNDQLKTLTPEETDLRTRQILMWATAADCMCALIDESEGQREEARLAREAMTNSTKELREEMRISRESTGESARSVRQTLIIATTVGLLLHFIIAFVYSRPAVEPFQAKSDRAVIVE